MFTNSQFMFVEKSNLYNIYSEILFQKVALGYLLHFVQNGSSKNILKHLCLHNHLKNPKVRRPGVHLGEPKNVKLGQNQLYITYIGESSSRKLRRAIYYTLYRMDPQKACKKTVFAQKCQTSENLKMPYIFPPDSRSTAP